MTTNKENVMDYYATLQAAADDATPATNPYSGASGTPRTSTAQLAGLVLLILLTVPPTLATVISPVFVIPSVLLGVGLCMPPRSTARVVLFSITALLDTLAIAVIALAILVLSTAKFG
jgi:hypothetical protein